MKAWRGAIAMVAVLAVAGCAGSPLDYPTVVAKAEQLLAEIFGTVPDESVLASTTGTHEHVSCDDAGFEQYDTWVAVTTAGDFDEAAHLDGVHDGYVTAGWADSRVDEGVRMLHPDGYLLEATAPDDGSLLFVVTSPCIAVPRDAAS